MARRKGTSRFDTLWEAVRDGTVADVRAILTAADGVPEERDEEGDPTPLMYAAALGRLEIVQALVEAGAEVNVIASPEPGLELPELPFLDPLMERGEIQPAVLCALAYAVGYGRTGVASFLQPYTSGELQRVAAAVGAAREQYLRSLDDKARKAVLRKRDQPESNAATERRALLAEHPKLSRWIVQCPLCPRQGYKPTMPAEIDRQGTAARVRRLFRPLALENYLCERCRDKVAKGQRAIVARAQKRRAGSPPQPKTKRPRVSNADEAPGHR
jgi:hypothetical protein